MLAITNAIIVMTDHYIYDGTVLVEDGKIVEFGRKVKIPEGAEILDVNGAYVGPGLIDIHTHADGETFFNDDDGAPEKEVKVSFRNVENPNGVRLEYYCLDANHDAELVREEIFTSTEFASYIKMPLYSTWLLKIVSL